MKKVIFAATGIAAFASAGIFLQRYLERRRDELQDDNASFDVTEFDKKITMLSKKYEADAIKMLIELISIPEEGTNDDPLCGSSGHEGLRLAYLKNKIIEIGAVLNPNDVYFDEYGNLVWTINDPEDDIPLSQRKTIYLDGHIDTYEVNRSDWKKVGNGIDCFKGLINADDVDYEKLKNELFFLPEKEKWNDLVFGCGAAHQLQGIVSQVYASKILLETCEYGSLRGANVISIATISSEVNDGGSIMYLMKQDLQRHQIPDCVILTETSGDLSLGPCCINIGQKGKCKIKIQITKNDDDNNNNINVLEYGSAIILEAKIKADKSLKNKKFLGKGTRTVNNCKLEINKNTNIPTKYMFEFERRYVEGEDLNLAIDEIKSLDSFKKAINDGCKIDISVPQYTEKSYKGASADNPQNYMYWITNPNNLVVKSALESYKRCVSPEINIDDKKTPDNLRKCPTINKWNFSTDGVGYLIKNDELMFSVEGKNWIQNKNFLHPPMFGIGSGFQQHIHKIGEYVHKHHMWCPIAVISRFPSLFVANSQ